MTKFFWRNATGHEIDILIDTGERVIPVEVKSGQTVAGDAVDTLAWWTSIPSNPNQSGVLIHGGEESFDFKGASASCLGSCAERRVDTTPTASRSTG